MMALLKYSLPCSIPFLLIIFLAGLILSERQNTRRMGQRCLWGLFLFYLSLSIPVFSRRLVAPLAWGLAPLQTVEAARGARAVVVLDGGTLRYHEREDWVELPNAVSAMRALEAVRVYRLLGNPIVIVSGGDSARDQNWKPESSALRDLIEKLGVPLQRVVLDSNSENTRASALNVIGLLKERNIFEFVLVTSPAHMRRAVLAFRAVGVDPVSSPCASPMDSYRGWSAFWPSSQTLLYSEQAMYDYIGLTYYFLRGWA